MNIRKNCIAVAAITVGFAASIMESGLSFAQISTTGNVSPIFNSAVDVTTNGRDLGSGGVGDILIGTAPGTNTLTIDANSLTLNQRLLDPVDPLAFDGAFVVVGGRQSSGGTGVITIQNGGTFNINVTDPGRITGAGLRLSDSSGIGLQGTVIVDNGALNLSSNSTTGSTDLTVGGGGPATMTLRNNASASLSSPNSGSRVFLGGSGALTVESGSTLRVGVDAAETAIATGSAGIFIGDDSFSGGLGGTMTVDNATVKIRNDSASNRPFVDVAGGPNTTLNVQNGANLGLINDDATGTSALDVGRGGTGTANVINLSHVSGHRLTAGADTASSNGTLTIDNSTVELISSSANSTFFRTGVDGGTGSIAISNNGSATVTSNGTGSAFADVGRDGGIGNFTMDGGSNLTVTGTSTGNAFMNVGRGGTGTVTINNSTLSLTQTNGGSGSLTVGRSGGTGTMTATNSALTVQDFFSVGRGGTGTVTLDNSTYNGTGQGHFIRIGREGASGTLNINNGSTFDGHRVHIGRNAGSGSSGFLNVDGATTVMNITGINTDGNGAAITVGRDQGTTGVMSVSGGATVNINSQGIPSASNGGLNLGGSRTSPGGGTGTLNINGGTVNVITGSTNVGRKSIGNIVNITNGGALNDSNTVNIAGRESNTGGSVNVGGLGSTLTANLIEIGLDSTTAGILSVTNGASVTAPTVNVNTGGSLFGNGTVNGNVNNNGGTIGPGTSPGTLTITGDYTQLAGSLLQIEIASITDFDILNIVGDANILGGTLEILLLDDFMPSIDETFNFFMAGGAITGAFDDFIFPVFDGRTFDLEVGADGALAFNTVTAPVPIPAALPLFLTALAGLGIVARRKRAVIET